MLGMFSFRGIACLLAASSIAACASGGPSAVQDQQSAAFEQKASAVIESAMEAGGYPGIAVSVARDGELLFAKGFGVADRETAAAVTAQTVFPIGSITKSFTGLAVAQLAASGKIDLDASISDYFDGLPDGWEAIRVRHLLNHTSGMFDYTDDPSIQAEPGAARDVAEMRAIWEGVPLAFEPGAAWRYTNSGYYLLGKVIEQASGLSYAAYIEKNILELFGLANTSYPEGKDNKPGAVGYDIVNGELVAAPAWSPSIPYSAGAVLSTVEDLATYSEALHRSDKVGGAARKILYIQDVIADAPISYALGGLNIQTVDGRKQYVHPGSIWGYTSYFSYYPEEGVSVSVLTNGDGSAIHPSSIERKLARIVFGEPQPANKDVELTAQDRAAISGEYSIFPMNFISSSIGFDDRNGVMFMVFGPLSDEIFSFPLRYVGDGRFVAYHDDELSIRFKSLKQEATEAEIVIYGGLLTARR